MHGPKYIRKERLVGVIARWFFISEKYGFRETQNHHNNFPTNTVPQTIDTWTLVDRKYHEIDETVPPLGCEGVTQDRHCTVVEPVPGICRPVS